VSIAILKVLDFVRVRLLISPDGFAFVGSCRRFDSVPGHHSPEDRIGIAALELLGVMGLRNAKVAQLKPEDLVDVPILRRLEQSGFIR
jgi:hypothetical protein